MEIRYSRFIDSNDHCYVNCITVGTTVGVGYSDNILSGRSYINHLRCCACVPREQQSCITRIEKNISDHHCVISEIDNWRLVHGDENCIGHDAETITHRYAIHTGCAGILCCINASVAPLVSSVAYVCVEQNASAHRSIGSEIKMDSIVVNRHVDGDR